MTAACLPSGALHVMESPIPLAPTCIADTGLPESLLEQLLLKIIYTRGEVSGRDLANAAGLRFSVIAPIISRFRRDHFLEVKRALSLGDISSVFTLSETGRHHAVEALTINQYAGPAPVPVEQYNRIVQAQRLGKGWLTPEMLQQAYGHMVMTPEVLNQIGPAVNSGKSFLIYGSPGNGKTYLAEALGRLDSPPIYVPYAVEYHGNILTVFDAIYHQPDESPTASSGVFVEDDSDRRWALCKRPFIITGGELTLEMLDLSYNASSHIYQAPFQMKANNGIYLIDDFGRQKVSPAEVLNRWIVAMERRVDYLTFRTGGKMCVPFDCFLVFSTNLAPHELGDEAFLRRIEYKLLVRSPRKEEFLRIFEMACERVGLEYDLSMIDRFVDRKYPATNKPFRRCHPRDILSHAVDILAFERRDPILDEETLERAFDSCFVDSSALMD